MRDTHYSGDDITFTLNGLAIESGRGPDEFLKIEKQEDSFGVQESQIDGEAAWFHKKGTYTIVTLTLMQTAAGNDVLNALHQADLLTGNGAGPIFIEDRRGNSKYVAPSARILKTPDESHQAEPGSLVWTIGVVGGLRLVGGH